MGTRKVVVADTIGSIKQVEVDEDRHAVFDGMLNAQFRTNPMMFGTPSDIQSLVGRKPSAKDATEALAFTVSQLAYTEQQLMTRYYLPPQGFDFVPVSYEAGPYATSVRYEIEDQVGNARWASSRANDAPRTDVGYAAREFQIAHGTTGYGYSQQELRTTAFLRRPLPDRRLMAAINDVRRFQSEVLLLGSTEKNFTGLYNNALVAHATSPSAAIWSGTATVAQILSDFGFGMYTAWTQSAQNVVPNRVIIPKLAYQYLSTTPASPTIPTVTILDYLLKNNLCNQKRGVQLRIEAGYDNATAGASGVPRTVFYDDTPDTLVGHIPMPLQFLAPEFRGLNVEVSGEWRQSGVEVKRITNMYYMDGT